MPIVTSEIDGHLYAVVSVRAFEGIDPEAIEVGSVDFDGEGTGDRLERHTKSWIGDVRETVGA